MPTLLPHLTHQGMSRCKTVVSLLQLIVAALVFNANFSSACAAAPVDMSTSDNVASELGEPGAYGEKRTWQSLQGSWGKRAWSTQPLTEGVDDVFLAEHWVPVLVNNEERMDPKYSLVYVADGAALNRLTNQRPMDQASNFLENSDESEGISNDKRTWKNMNVAWGKRRNAPAWNKFRGAWGKREPGWNNLKGMWGKRATKDWQKLHGGWGKRAQQFEDSN